MRKLLTILGIILLASCGGNDDGGNEETNNNIPPSQPSLIEPSNNSTVIQHGIDDPVYFEWSKVTDPDNDLNGFIFYISESIQEINTSSYVGVQNNNIFTNMTDSFINLEPNKTYYWQVASRDSNNNLNYSTIWSFYLEDGNTPSQPNLIFPLNETECSNDNLTFEWNASTNSSGTNINYKLHISESPSFDNNVDIYDTTNNTSYNVSLPQSTALYWKVEAISNSTNSSFSEIRSLYTQGDGVSNTIPQIEYTSPNDGSVITGNSINLQWTASDNETTNSNLKYKVYFSEVGQSLNLITEDTGIDNYTINNLNSNTTYQWSIWVTDGDGATNVGEVYTCTVN